MEKVIYTYSEGSGSKINTEKSQGVWLGAWKTRKDKPGKFIWTNHMIKILGIYFGNEVKPQDNWTGKVNKMKSILNRWKERYLTLKGKAVVINSLIGGSLAYYGSIVSCPNEFIQEMEKAIMNFYWSGKPDKIKRDTIRGPPERGGTGLINISCKLDSLKLKWLTKYPKTEGKWKLLFDFWIRNANNDQNLGWFVFSNSKRIGSKIPPFYRDLIQAFQNAGGIMKANVTCRNEALEIPLWDNKIITGSEKVLDSKILKPCGLVILEDVIKKGNLISFQELAVKCNIKAINAGKIMSGLKKHVCSNFVSETREGPACHVSSMLYLNDFDQECVPLSDMSVKQTYQTMIRKKFIVPVAEKVWPVKLNICPNAVDWGEIWKKTTKKA